MIIIIIKQKWWYCAVGHHAKYPNIDLILITRENDEHRTTSIESRNESKSLHFLILTFKSGEHQYSDVITIAITSQPTGVKRLLNRLFRRRSQKISKLYVIGLCEGNSPVSGEFPAQRTSYAENISIWWRHHDYSGWEPLSSAGADVTLDYLIHEKPLAAS